MSARCASCGKRVSLWPFRMSRCPDCRALSCRDCRHPHKDFAGPCPVCKGKRIQGSNIAAAFAMALLFLPAIGLVAAWGAHNGYVALERENLPAIGMDEAHAGDRVKLVGFIVSGGAVALDGHMDRSGDEPRWVFDKNSITVRDAAASWHFDVGTDQAKVRPGPHRSARDPDGTCYRDADRVFIVGRVTENGNGSGEMAAEAISPDGDFGTGYELYLWSAVSAACFGVIAYMAAMYAYWKWGSEATIRQGGEVFRHSAVGAYYPEAGRRTVLNETAGKKEKTLRKAAAWSGAFTAACLALWANPFVPFRDVCWSTMIFAPVAFALILLLGVAVDWYLTPRAFEYDGTGFGFDLGRNRKKGMKWAHVSMLNFNGVSSVEITDRASCNVTVWPRKGFPVTIMNVDRAIAATLEKEHGSRKAGAKDDLDLTGPDIAGLMDIMGKGPARDDRPGDGNAKG